MTSRSGTSGNPFFTMTRQTVSCTQGQSRRRPPGDGPSSFPESKPAMMRALVIVLAVLAGAKILAQERLYRDGAEGALIQAYRERAMAACQSQDAASARSSSAAAPLWTRPASIALVIGRRSANVNLWEVDNALWPARFKHPHVVLSAHEDRSGPVCEYDVVEGRAYLTQL
jgi:hypothetical protein